MTPFSETINRAKDLQRRALNLQCEIHRFFHDNQADLAARAGGLIWSAWDLTEQYFRMGFVDEGLFELEISQQHSAEAIIERFQVSQFYLPDATQDTREWMAVRVPLTLDNILDKTESFLLDAERLFAEGKRLHIEPPPFYQEPLEPTGPPPRHLEISSTLSDGTPGTIMQIPVAETLTSSLILPGRSLYITTAEAAEIEVFNGLKAAEIGPLSIKVSPTGWFGKSTGAVFIRFDNGAATALQLTFDSKNVSIDKL